MSSSGRWSPSPKRQPAADLAALRGKQLRVKEILETLLYTVDVRIERTLQTELTEVEEFIKHLVPIYRLPHDILAEVAYIFSKVENNGAWLFSAVCKTWRAAALCNPRAWTDIHLIASEDESRSFNRIYGRAICRPPLHRTPDPVLAISRAGVLPLSLEFHGAIATTENMNDFLSKVVSYVGRFCIHECGDSFPPLLSHPFPPLLSHPTPKLKELIIVPEEGDVLGGYGRMFSNILFNIFGTIDLAECTRALGHLWVVCFHKMHWDAKYFAAFRQLQDITLHDCICSPDDDIHQFLQANCGTLERLHLSLTLSAEVQDRPLTPIHFPRLRTVSFNVARRAQNSYRSNQSPPFIMYSHYIALFQSLIAPKAIELQVYALYIENLDFTTQYPSLQHLHIVIPVTMDDVYPCVNSLKFLIRSSPLRTLNLFIGTNHYKLPEREYEIAAVLTGFLCDPLVLDHATFMEVSIKLRPDSELVWEQVSNQWMRRRKTLLIRYATNSECIEDGFTKIHDPRLEDIRV